MSSELSQDPKTGMLTGPDGSIQVFGVERKLRFLDILRQMFPHLTKACEASNVSIETYYNHYKRDVEFKRRVDQIREEKLDNLEAVMLDNGEKPAGFLDRIAYLRAHRPSLYNPAQKVIVERQDHISIDVANERVQRLRNVIDADIVETYDKRNLPPDPPTKTP